MEAWRLGGPEAERDRGKKGSEGLEGHLGINLASFCVIFGDLVPSKGPSTRPKAQTEELLFRDL